MIHALITFIYCLILPAWTYGFIVGFYFGREFTQAEYRVIEQYYGHKRENMPWYGGFEPRAWNVKSMLDCILPALVAEIMYVLL